MIGGRGHGEKWMGLIHILEIKPTGLAAELDVGPWGWGRNLENSWVFGSSREIDAKIFGDTYRKDLEEELICKRLPRSFLSVCF